MPVLEAVTDWLVALLMAALLVAVYGSWLATYRVPGARPSGSSLWFTLPQWAQIAAGLAGSALGFYVGYLLWKPLVAPLPGGLSLVLRLAGLVVLAGGTALWFWARWTLGAMMGVSTSAAVQLRAQHRLICQGPYGLVRHPMYLAYWLVLAGLLIMYRTWTVLALLLLMTASLSRRARREDEALEAAFGDAWRSYAARAPMFLPRWMNRR